MTTATLSPLFPLAFALSDVREHPLARHVHPLRSQAAVVRALLDELERTIPGSSVERLVTAQLVEDVARLGCRLIETAGALSKAVESGPCERDAKPPGGSSSAA